MTRREWYEIDHECRMSALLNGSMGADGVMRCAHGYTWPPGTVIRTRYGNYVVGETEPVRDESVASVARVPPLELPGGLFR